MNNYFENSRDTIENSSIETAEIIDTEKKVDYYEPHEFDECLSEYSSEVNTEYSDKSGYSPSDFDACVIGDKSSVETKSIEETSCAKNDYSPRTVVQEISPSAELGTKDEDLEISNNQPEDFEKPGADSGEHISLEERTENTADDSNLSLGQLRALCTKNDAELSCSLEERSKLESDLARKFNYFENADRNDPNYKLELSDYNNLQLEKESLNKKIESLYDEQADLDLRTRELRDTQIRDGSNSIVLCDKCVFESEALQSRYDKLADSVKPDSGDSEKLFEDSRGTMTDLSGVREKMDLAMDAKMDEIGEYTRKSGLAARELKEDRRYQELISDYNTFKAKRDLANYTLLRLDENNTSLARRSNIEYKSFQDVFSSGNELENTRDDAELFQGNIEDTELNNDSQTESSRNRATDRVKLSTLDDRILENIPPERIAAVDAAYHKAPNELVTAMNDCSEKFKDIKESGFGFNEKGEYVKNGCFYNPYEKRIFMNEREDNEAYAEIFQHEVFHNMDDIRGWESHSIEYIEALNSDFAAMDKSTLEGREKFTAMLDDLFSSDACYDRNISDCLSALFTNDKQIVECYRKEGCAYYRHKNKYWAREFSREEEIYANMGAIYSANNRASVNFLERYFPNASSRFKKYYNLDK